ncbi:MAG: alpha-hydroxy-acid oxidizing protein [Treponema sp.]|nr:alpha-hydroxy-acid oxidizing protein [Treponema sp.]
MSTGNNFKCKFCKICNGRGCTGELPGMGGVRKNENFILNCLGWEKLRRENPEVQKKIENLLEKNPEERIPNISIAPMTGAVENIGFPDEESYYSEIIQAVHKVGIGLSIGDGFPDEKLKFGIAALKKIKNETQTSVFIKPYSNWKILERLEWASGCAKIAGIDIDSYNILTMRNKVQLEKKSAVQLKEIKSTIKIPFAIKGIFTESDIELVKEVKPDIAYISNHGGRIETRKGSTAEFLLENGKEIRNSCGEIWVDGGVRNSLDVATAMALGASCVLAGRPFATALCKGGAEEMCRKALELSLLAYSRQTR